MCKISVIYKMPSVKWCHRTNLISSNSNILVMFWTSCSMTLIKLSCVYLEQLSALWCIHHHTPYVLPRWWRFFPHFFVWNCLCRRKTNKCYQLNTSTLSKLYSFKKTNYYDYVHKHKNVTWLATQHPWAFLWMHLYIQWHVSSCRFERCHCTGTSKWAFGIFWLKKHKSLYYLLRHFTGLVNNLCLI